jgi:hypothetical protein
MAFTGGCLCGAVRYEIDAEPLFSGRCYCDDCRKVSGSGHNAVLAFPEPAVKIKGELKAFTKAGGSGEPITRKFCPNCGSRITGGATIMPGVAFVTAASLDDPEQFEPQMSVYASRAPSWDPPPRDKPVFEEMPPRA